jgi:hypothetical protein
MRCLSASSGCGWAYGFTFTPLPPQTLPKICESWLKSYLMQVCKPCHYTLVEAVEPFKLPPTSMSYMRCFSTFSGSRWAYGFTLTLLPPQMLPQICETLLKSYLMQVRKPCHYALVEAVDPCKMYTMSMPYIYERCEHLLRLWMGIWLHIHTITTSDTYQICDFRWLKSDSIQVCKPCHYAFVETVEPFKLHHMSMSYIYERFEHRLSCGWAYGFTFTPLPPQTLTRFVRVR